MPSAWAPMPRRVKNQAAPTATDIEQSIPGTKAQFPADMVELALLSRFQVIRRFTEIGAGIDHLFVQPQGIKIIGDVVVKADGLAIPLRGMPPAVESGLSFVAIG